MTESRRLSAFETHSVRMLRFWTVTIQGPAEDIARIMEHVTAVTPLRQGPYDNNAYATAAGTERYRPLDGAAAGAESVVRELPGVVEVSFDLTPDQNILEQVVEAVFQIHSYQEPVIKVQDTLVSRSKGLDDRDNPHRWWNTTGDWKQAAG
jgi:hypothetical protein